MDWDTAYTRAQSEPLLWGWGAHTPMELYNIYHTMEKTGLAGIPLTPTRRWTGTWTRPWRRATWEASYELWKRHSGTGTAGITQEGDIPWIWLVNIDHFVLVQRAFRWRNRSCTHYGQWAVDCE